MCGDWTIIGEGLGLGRIPFPITFRSYFGHNFRLQTSDFRDIYLNRIAEKVNQYLSGCVPVDETYGT